jgi:hypothetical protein
MKQNSQKLLYLSDHPMKPAISTAQTEANIQAVLGLLRETPDRLSVLSKGYPEQQLRQPLAPGERTFNEVLGHLIHAEALASQAIYLALLVDQPLLPAIHAERDLGKLLRFDLHPITQLIDYFSLRRRVLLRVLEPLSETQWARCVREARKQRKESIYWRARALALHELEHLQDLESKLNHKSQG